VLGRDVQIHQLRLAAPTRVPSLVQAVVGGDPIDERQRRIDGDELSGEERAFRNTSCVASRAASVSRKSRRHRR